MPNISRDPRTVFVWAVSYVVLGAQRLFCRTPQQFGKALLYLAIITTRRLKDFSGLELFVLRGMSSMQHANTVWYQQRIRFYNLTGEGWRLEPMWSTYPAVCYGRINNIWICLDCRASWKRTNDWAVVPVSYHASSRVYELLR